MIQLARTRLVACALVLASACADSDSDEAAGDIPVTLTLTGPATSALGASARVHVTVFGYDGNLADVGADRIVVASAAVAALPTTMTFDFPADASTQIVEGAPVPAGSAVFYALVTVDVDGDGQICPGDLIDATPASPKGWSSDGPTGPVAVGLVVAGADYTCRSATP